MDNLEEMDKFLEKYNFPKLNQEEIENLNRPITSMEIKTVIKIFQSTKVQGQTVSLANSHLSYSNSSRKLQRKENSQTHSMRPPSP